MPRSPGSGLGARTIPVQRISVLEQVPAETDFVSRLGEAARLHLIRFRLGFSEGDLVSAAEELFRLEKIGFMICNGEGQMLHYRIGLLAAGRGRAGFRAFGRQRANAAGGAGADFGNARRRLKGPDGLAQSLRVDLCTIALAQLDRTVEDPDLEKVVDRLLEVYYVPHRNLAARSGPRACGHR